MIAFPSPAERPRPRRTRRGSALWPLLAVCLTLWGCPGTPRVPDTQPTARTIERVEAPRDVDDNTLGPRASLGGASMQVPRGWIPTRGAALHWENAGGGDDQRSSAANMNVIVGDPKALDVTWEAFWQDLSEQYAARTEGIQDITASGRDDVGGHPTWFFEIRRRESGVDYALLQYIIGADRQIYYLTFAARVDEFPRFEPLFRRCVASFRAQ